jgi:pilus assembly protein Flp/PilA
MTKLKQAIRAFYQDEDGAAAIEYGLLVALLAIAIIGALTTLGEETNSGFQNFNDTLEAAKG